MGSEFGKLHIHIHVYLTVVFEEGEKSSPNVPGPHGAIKPWAKSPGPNGTITPWSPTRGLYITL